MARASAHIGLPYARVGCTTCGHMGDGDRQKGPQTGRAQAWACEPGAGGMWEGVGEIVCPRGYQGASLFYGR